MIYGIILAAGVGKRFKKVPIKPLFIINNKPLFLHSLDTFLTNKKIDNVLLVINKKYEQYFKKYLSLPKYKNTSIVYGDENARWKSLINAMNYLESHCSLKPNDIIITHDAARININNEIINNNIQIASKYDYASTTLPLHDSIVQINHSIKYLDRSNKYIIQTPQTIKYKLWKNIKPQIPTKVTDLFTYLQVKTEKKNLVNGSLLNFKITTEEDLKLI